jgi:hypothetical protein
MSNCRPRPIVTQLSKVRLKVTEAKRAASKMRRSSGWFRIDNVAPILLNGRPFPNVYRRQRKADGFLGTGWNPVGEMLGFHGVLFQAP